MAKILIVGYGYIGQPLAKSLVSKGNEVVAISRTNKEPTTGVSTIKADLFELDDLPEVAAVSYLVSADPLSEDMYRKAYIDGPKKIWSLFKRKKPYRFLFASSTSVMIRISSLCLFSRRRFLAYFVQPQFQPRQALLSPAAWRHSLLQYVASPQKWVVVISFRHIAHGAMAVSI